MHRGPLGRAQGGGLHVIGATLVARYGQRDSLAVVERCSGHGHRTPRLTGGVLALDFYNAVARRGLEHLP